jgi:DNA transposition AAA+ family ATPase
LQNEEADQRPFVETTVAKMMLSRMAVTHEQRGIMVASGPWGIGKTTAIDVFARNNEGACIIVKVEPAGSAKRGITPTKLMQLSLETLRSMRSRSTMSELSRSPWTLRHLINDEIHTLFGPEAWGAGDEPPLFTFIFDEAQYLSRDAIEALRFWNDHDRTTTPFPVGLIFVGNNEFAMEETLGGNSVLSGAVRSRLTCELPLSYTHLDDIDLQLFAQSRGIHDPAALKEFVRHFSQPRVKRDLRNAERLLTNLKRDADGEAITVEAVRELLIAA